MTTIHLRTDLQRDEGLRLEAYPDPLSGGVPWTIGYGHTGTDVSHGTVWTQAQADQALDHDIAHAEGLLDANAPWWRTQDDVRQDALCELCFNMGWGNGTTGLSGFHHFLNHVRTGQYGEAATDLEHSRWYSQVGQRAHRIVYMISTGTRQTTH